MESVVLFFYYVLENIKNSPYTTAIAFFVLIVSFRSTWISSKALRISEKNTREQTRLASAEKKTNLLSILQDAQIFAIHATKELSLTELILNQLVKLLGSSPPKERIEDISKTRETLKDLKKLINKLEETIKSRFTEVNEMEEDIDPYDYEIITPKIMILKNEAQARYNRAEIFHNELKGYYDLILNEILVLNRNR